MNKRPLSITVIGWIFIAFGCIAALYAGLSPLIDADAARRVAELKAQRPFEFGLLWIIRILAVLCGAFLLRGFNWARLTLVVWMGYHVIISMLHSLFELVVHSLLFIVLICFLFRPRSSAYFRGATTPPRIPKSDDTTAA